MTIIKVEHARTERTIHGYENYWRLNNEKGKEY